MVGGNAFGFQLFDSFMYNAVGGSPSDQCYVGLFRPFYFRRCDVLVQELLAAKRDLTLPKLLKQWSRFDLLIIDDIGYVQHSR